MNGVQHVGRGRRQSRLHRTDEKTYEYLKGRPKAPKDKGLDAALAYWRTLQSDDGAHFDREIKLDAAKLAAACHLGNQPENRVVSVTGRVPRLDPGVTDEKKRELIERALAYMGLKAARRFPTSQSTASLSVPALMRASRDLRAVAKWSRQEGQRPVNAMIVPRLGAWSKSRPRWKVSTDLRPKPASSGASRACRCACHDPDSSLPASAAPRPRTAILSGRQGYKGRTTLSPPAMAAAAAIAGHFVDYREWN